MADTTQTASLIGTGVGGALGGIFGGGVGAVPGAAAGGGIGATLGGLFSKPKPKPKPVPWYENKEVLLIAGGLAIVGLVLYLGLHKKAGG